MDPEQNVPRESSGLRTFIASLIGFVSCIGIWISAPYVSYLMGGPQISDDYLPIGALLIILLFALVINPLLGLCRSSWKLTTRQMIIILGMVLVGSFLSGQGLLKGLPYSLAGACIKSSTEQKTADIYQESRLQRSLFPDNLGYNEKVFASERLTTGLRRNESIPWKAWVRPLISWAPLFIFYGLMMIGLARIVVPQWRDTERLSFPLLEIYRPLVQAPEKDRLFGSTFRQGKFWIAAGTVFLLHFLAGSSKQWSGSVPAVPLNWNIADCFTGDLMTNAPWYFSASSIYFTYVAIAFFVTTRISFSIWFTMIAYGVYQMIRITYYPPYNWDTINDHRSGVALVLTITILWLGRARWKEVASSLLRLGGTDKERENFKVGWMFLIGMLGMAAWFIWAGTSPGWAFIFVTTGFVACLLISRVVAETGLPFLRIYDWNPLALMNITGIPFVGVATYFLGWIAQTLYHVGTRISGAAMATEVFALEEPAIKERTRSFNSLLWVTLIAGVIVVSTALVYYGYRFDSNLIGDPPFAKASTSFDNLTDTVTSWKEQGVMEKPYYSKAGNTLAGAAIAGILMWLCMRFPAWPLHPVGFLMLFSYYGEVIWASVFIGWLAKTLIVRYGGSSLYSKAKPFFLGLIFGELIAAVFWCVLSMALSFTGNTYLMIPVRP